MGHSDRKSGDGAAGLQPADHEAADAGLGDALGEVRFIARMAFWATTLVALGLLIGATPVEARPERLFGFLLAELALLLLIRLHTTRPAVGVVLGAVLAAIFGREAAGMVEMSAYAVLLTAFMLGSAALASDFVRLRALVMGRRSRLARPAKAELSLDDLALRELSRARRLESPLVLAALRPVRGPRWRSVSSAAAAHEFAARLRATDIVACGPGGRLYALMPDTTAVAAGEVVRRAVVEAGLADRYAIGLAGFPSEELTWNCLRDRAESRAASAERTADELEELWAAAH